MPGTEPTNEKERDEVISIRGNPVTTVTSSEARTSMSDLLRQVEYARTRVVVTRNGKNVAALVTMDDLRLLSQILERFEDIEDVLEADRRLADPDEHRIPFEDVAKELNL